MSASIIGKLLVQVRLAFANARRIAGELSWELARLNRAGIDAARMAGLSRVERTRAVKQALAAKHRETARCC